MLLNKKCIYVLFLFYGALLFTQDTKPMTPATISNTTQKILAHIAQPAGSMLPKIRNTYNSSTPRLPSIINELKTQPDFIFLMRTAVQKNLLNVNVLPKYHAKELDNNPLKVLTNAQMQSDNESIVTRKDAEALVAFLLIIHHVLQNDSQQMLLDDKTGTIMHKSDPNNIPLSIIPSNKVQPQIQLNLNMNLHASRIKPLYYCPDTVARIMEKNDYINNQYKALKREKNIFEQKVKTIQHTNIQLEQEINKQKEEYTKLQKDLKEKAKEVEQKQEAIEQLKKENTITILNLEEKLTSIGGILSTVKGTLKETETQLVTTTQTLQKQQEQNANLKKEKEQLTTEFNNLKEKYEDQATLLDHHSEEHKRLKLSFHTIQELIENDKKEEIEQFKKEIAAFQESLTNITNEDKETVRKIKEKQNSIETTWQKNMTELEEKHDIILQNTKATYQIMLEKNSSDIQTLTTRNNRLQNNNTMLTAGLLIAFVFVCLENIYYQNKIEKLTQLLHK